MSLPMYTAPRRWLGAMLCASRLKRASALAAASLLAVLVAWTARAVAPPTLPRAIEAQRTLAARHPADAGAQVDLGNLLLLGGQTAEAEAAYRSALTIEPENAAAHFNLGLLLQQRGESTRALREFRRTLAIDERHAWAHYQIGMIEAARGFESLAVRSYAHAFALDPRLRFPDVNPHVIDNPLTTRAMLAAYRLNLTQSPLSPDYDDPLRVAGLLVPGLAPESEPTAGDPALIAAPPAAAQMPRTAAATAGAQGVTRPNSGISATDPTRGASGAVATEPAFTRTIGAGDLTAPRTGQIVGRGGIAPSPGAVARPPSPPVYEPAPDDEDTDGVADEPEGRAPRPTSPPGFQPGVPSTGRLEMRLVPDRPAPTDPTAVSDRA